MVKDHNAKVEEMKDHINELRDKVRKSRAASLKVGQLEKRFSEERKSTIVERVREESQGRIALEKLTVLC